MNPVVSRRGWEKSSGTLLRESLRAAGVRLNFPLNIKQKRRDGSTTGVLRNSMSSKKLTLPRQSDDEERMGSL